VPLRVRAVCSRNLRIESSSRTTDFTWAASCTLSTPLKGRVKGARSRSGTSTPHRKDTTFTFPASGMNVVIEDVKSRGTQYSSRSRKATWLKPCRRASAASSAYAAHWKFSRRAKQSASSSSAFRDVTSGCSAEIAARIRSVVSVVPLTQTSTASKPKCRWWKTQSAR
jgi:hypothetical protein